MQVKLHHIIHFNRLNNRGGIKVPKIFIMIKAKNVIKKRGGNKQGKPGNVSENLYFNSKNETDASKCGETEPSRKHNIIDDFWLILKIQQSKFYRIFISSQN